MLRLQQIIQNLFIRLEGFLYRIFGFFRQIFDFFSQRVILLLQFLGLTKSGYFLEDEVKDIKPTQTTQTQTQSQKAESATNNRRRPDAKMDYYLNMVRQTKDSP